MYHTAEVDETSFFLSGTLFHSERDAGLKLTSQKGLQTSFLKWYSKNDFEIQK